MAKRSEALGILSYNVSYALNEQKRFLYKNSYCYKYSHFQNAWKS